MDSDKLSYKKTALLNLECGFFIGHEQIILLGGSCCAKYYLYQ